MNAALPQKSWAAVASALPPDVRRGLCPAVKRFSGFGAMPPASSFFHASVARRSTHQGRSPNSQRE